MAFRNIVVDVDVDVDVDDGAVMLGGNISVATVTVVVVVDEDPFRMGDPRNDIILLGIFVPADIYIYEQFRLFFGSCYL